MSHDAIYEESLAALLKHVEHPTSDRCACGYHYRIDRIGRFIPLVQNAGHYADVVVAAVRPLIEADLRERLAAAIERDWHEACAGYRNADKCETCRIYTDVLHLLRERP